MVAAGIRGRGLGFCEEENDILRVRERKMSVGVCVVCVNRPQPQGPTYLSYL